MTGKDKIKRPVFNKTNDNIEWAPYSWNPVTGCKFGCQYCYARDIANRFMGGFEPTFHPDRLSAPKNTPQAGKLKKNVFVCSMADLFGHWVEKPWIDQVLEVVKEQSQWTYIFLTKNPIRYLEFKFPINCFLGATADTQKRFNTAIEVFSHIKRRVRFISAEPLLERITPPKKMDMLEWVIIGGQSKSSGAPAMQPEWNWCKPLVKAALVNDVPLYFKPNLITRPQETPKKQRKEKVVVGSRVFFFD